MRRRFVTPNCPELVTTRVTRRSRVSTPRSPRPSSSSSSSSRRPRLDSHPRSSVVSDVLPRSTPVFSASTPPPRLPHRRTRARPASSPSFPSFPSSSVCRSSEFEFESNRRLLARSRAFRPSTRTGNDHMDSSESLAPTPRASMTVLVARFRFVAALSDAPFDDAFDSDARDGTDASARRARAAACLRRPT